MPVWLVALWYAANRTLDWLTAWMGLFAAVQREEIWLLLKAEQGTLFPPRESAQTRLHDLSSRKGDAHTSSHTWPHPLPTSPQHAHNHCPQAPTCRQHDMTCTHQTRLTSGARYSGVPQKVLVVAPNVISSLHKPKSVSFMWPSTSSNRFSSYMSHVTPCMVTWHTTYVH